jgi:hypothetical protein
LIIFLIWQIVVQAANSRPHDRDQHQAQQERQPPPRAARGTCFCGFIFHWPSYSGKRRVGHALKWRVPGATPQKSSAGALPQAP